MGLETILDGFSEYFAKLANDKLLMLILITLISLYTSLWVKSLQSYTVHVFNNKYFKFVLFVLISYIASGNPALGVILAISVLVTLQTITYTSANLENFNPSNLRNIDYSNLQQSRNMTNGLHTQQDPNIYLSEPLLKQKDLSKMGRNLNLKLETPSQLYEKMIKQGRVLLDDSAELKSDLKVRFDAREENIANIAERDGRMLVQSGLNRLQPADSGEYNSWLDEQSIKSLKSDEEPNNKLSYVKYDRFVENYSDNELIMDLFNLLRTKYNEITMNKSLKNSELDTKLQEIYDTEFDLLIAIYEVKTNKLKESDNEQIKKKIEYIKELRANKNVNYYTELNKLSELLC